MSEEGLAACRATSARTDECRESCASIAEPCSGIAAEGGASSTCTDVVAHHCRNNGLEYCAAGDTVNGCNLVAAEDRRGRSAVTLDPRRGGCIRVSPGTLVQLVYPFDLAAPTDGTCGGKGWLGRIGCAVRKLTLVVGGEAGERDVASPFNTAFESSKSVRFDTAGTFGFWTLWGYWGAVIVDDTPAE